MSIILLLVILGLLIATFVQVFTMSWTPRFETKFLYTDYNGTNYQRIVGLTNFKVEVTVYNLSVKRDVITQHINTTLGTTTDVPENAPWYDVTQALQKRIQREVGKNMVKIEFDNKYFYTSK
jgi:hypothetical protein